MDLRQLEHWTREALVAEAARRGVGSPTLLTRRELLDAIAADAEAHGEVVTRSAIARARRFLERFAFGAAGPPSHAAPASEPAPAAGTAAPTPVPRPAAPPSVTPDDAPPVVVEPEPVSPPSVEPVRTRTMARLLAAQGHIARARAIYDALLGGTQDDAVLRREAEALAPAASNTRAAVVEPALRAVNGVTPPVRHSVDLVTALVVDPTTLFVCWEVSEAGVRRARAVAGPDASLSLRVMIAASDASGHVTTRELTRDSLPDVGETFVTDLPPGASCTAAVGVVGARFVAIAHAPPAETPPATQRASLSMAVLIRADAVRSGTVASSATALTPAESSSRFAEAARAAVLEAAEDAAPQGIAIAPSSPGGDATGRGWPTSRA